MEYAKTQLDPEMSHMRVIQREDGRLQYVPKTPFLDVVAGYKRSMESPTYKQRLARELYGDAPPNMEEVEKNLQRRKDLLGNLVVTEKRDASPNAEGEMGEYIQPQYDKEGKPRIVINPQQARKHSTETSVYAHEVGHAMDTEINDAFQMKTSPFTKKKKEILGEPNRDFYYQYQTEYGLANSDGREAVVAQILKDVKDGKLKITDSKENFDYAVKNRFPGSTGSNVDVIQKILSKTNADKNYRNKLMESEGFKKIEAYENFMQHSRFQDYLMNDTEVKAKINALRMRAHLEHGYNFDEPFNIEKYPTLKGDENYQQLNKELRIPDEAINKLSEYIAYDKSGGDVGKAAAKNGMVIPLGKFNYAVKNRAKGGLPKAEQGMVVPPEGDEPTYKGKMLPEVVVKAQANPTNLFLQYALNRARPMSMSTGTDLEERNLLNQANFEQQQLYNSIQEGDFDGKKKELFEARYGTSPHRWRYDTDPAYKQEVDDRMEKTKNIYGTIDLPATNIYSKKYAGNPNLAFMTHKGMSPEGKRAMEESNLAVIGSVLPVPGLQTVGRVPSVFTPLVKAASKLANRRKVGMAWNGGSLDDLLNHLNFQIKKSNQFEPDSPAGMTLEAFKSRIQSPEGIRRMNELGITEKQLLQEIQLLKNRKTPGDYSPSSNEINLDPFSPLPKTITRHEIEHAVQNAVRNSAKKEIGNFQPADIGTPEYNKTFRRMMSISDIDHSLHKLDLKDINDLPEGFSKTVKISDLTQPSAAIKGKVTTETLVNLGDDRAALDYFKTGSAGQERSAFLAEVQQHMANTGIIKDPYQKITVNDVKTAYTLDDGKYADRKFLRLFNIMKPTEANFQLIADNLNKMLKITGATIGGGAALKQANKQNEQ
jgi:hypothetical protein